MTDMPIDIAMPAYNCAAWIDDLLNSILSQDYTDWRIIARDDDSSDNTAAILQRWQERLKERFVVLEDSSKTNLGMIGNYDAVLKRSAARWVMLADPDDVWLPNKISKALDVMDAAEKACEANTPILVCSDAAVVDDHLKEIAPSYWRWLNQNPELLSVFHRTIVESAALTSTMMVNRALLNVALPLIGASCPDWWLAMVACAFGKIVSIPERTILYRRHSANDSLAPLTSTIPEAVVRVGQARKRIRRLIRQYAVQAGEFHRRFGSKVPSTDADALSAAAILPSLGWLARRHVIIGHKLWFASPVKNAGLMIFT